MRLEKDLWRELKRYKVKFVGQGLKIGLYSVLLTYWVTLLAGTFSWLS